MTEFSEGTTQARVTVLGAGTMGRAMTARLLHSGFDVNVWSRHPATTLPSIDLGATGYADAADAVAGVEVVLTMLSNLDATSAVMFDAKALDAMDPGTTWAQMATIGVAGTHRLSDEVAARRPDVAFVDAPVSGSREPAESGQLLILASGTQPPSRGLEAVFAALGKATMWLGSVGAGSAMKLVLNTWLAFQIEGAAESAGLADHFGIDPALLLEALGDSPIASRYALTKLGRMLEEDYRAEFALDMALKDLNLVANDGGSGTTPVAGAIAKRWRALIQDGSSGLDVSAARRGLGETMSHTTGVGERHGYGAPEAAGTSGTGSLVRLGER